MDTGHETPKQTSINPSSNVGVVIVSFPVAEVFYMSHISYGLQILTRHSCLSDSMQTRINHDLSQVRNFGSVALT